MKNNDFGLFGPSWEVAWGVLVASWLVWRPCWRVLERSRAVLGGPEPALVASGAVREPSEPRPGALGAPGTAMRTRGPGPGARPRDDYF